MDKSGEEGKHGGAWGNTQFPYLLGWGLGGILRCLLQVPSLEAKSRKVL